MAASDQERSKLAVSYVSFLQKGWPVLHTFFVLPAIFACTWRSSLFLRRLPPQRHRSRGGVESILDSASAALSNGVQCMRIPGSSSEKPMVALRYRIFTVCMCINSLRACFPDTVTWYVATLLWSEPEFWPLTGYPHFYDVMAQIANGWHCAIVNHNCARCMYKLWGQLIINYHRPDYIWCEMH